MYCIGVPCALWVYSDGVFNGWVKVWLYCHAKMYECLTVLYVYIMLVYFMSVLYVWARGSVYSVNWFTVQEHYFGLLDAYTLRKCVGCWVNYVRLCTV
jgi:hypothetical protein